MIMAKKRSIVKRTSYYFLPNCTFFTDFATRACLKIHRTARSDPVEGFERLLVFDENYIFLISQQR